MDCLSFFTFRMLHLQKNIFFPKKKKKFFGAFEFCKNFLPSGLVSILIFGANFDILKNNFAFDFMHVLNVHLHIIKIHLYYAMLNFNRKSFFTIGTQPIHCIFDENTMD